MNQPTKKPTNKVSAIAVGGAVAVIIVAVLGSFGVEATPELSAAIATIVAFVLGYVVSE